MHSLKVTRRTALAGAAAAPIAASLAAPLRADGHAGPQNAIQNTFSLGDFQVSTLLAGTRPVEDIQSIFGTNVSAEEFAAVSAENFIPADKAQFFFTPTVVRTGAETILFDAGLSAAGTGAALSQAGVAADDIDIVVLTHMHGDHIGGLTDDAGAPTFPNARYVTGQVEYDHWAAQGNERFDGKVKPFAEKMTFLGNDGSVASGITAVGAFGHTPGHMAYRIESGGEQLILIADAANHYVWSVGYPDWEVRFDMDKAAAAATRRSLMDMISADRMLMIGYHMPFPGMGYVETRGDGFRYIPATYQMML